MLNSLKYSLKFKWFNNTINFSTDLNKIEKWAPELITSIILKNFKFVDKQTVKIWENE